MQLRASLTGNLAEILDKELKNAEIAVTRGISTATSQLKDAMRKQVKSARLTLSSNNNIVSILSINRIISIICIDDIIL